MIFLDSTESTHTFLKEYIQKNGYKRPLSIVTQHQTNGVGSRDNNWDGESGNLFFSFVIDQKLLPNDLPIQSSSIYFSYILKEILSSLGSKVFLKWPNDFYVYEKKIGGTITSLSHGLYYCGIGLNLKKISNSYGFLDIEVDVKNLLEYYFVCLSEKKTWKQIFSKYLLEFENSKQYNTTIKNEKISLRDAVLNNDGSISIKNEKVFSSR